MYAVKEIFYTLQGEGANAGRPAVFCRFAGCNLWSGREVDRADAACTFCDTDFVGTDGPGGGKFRTADDLAGACAASAGGATAGPLVVLTGGEPMLQVDAALADALHAHGFEIAIETNGTLPVAAGIDWICVSPKAGTTLAQTTGRRAEIGVPANGVNAGGDGRIVASSTAICNLWTALTGPGIRRLPWPTARRTRNGGCRFRPIN